jgi:hypothetical protein
MCLHINYQVDTIFETLIRDLHNGLLFVNPYTDAALKFEIPTKSFLALAKRLL